jgi:hypothetical protein
MGNPGTHLFSEKNAVRVRAFSDSTNQGGTKQYLGPEDEYFDEALAEANREAQAFKAIRRQA